MEGHFPCNSEINYGTQCPEHAGEISPTDGSKAVLFRGKRSSKAVRNQTSHRTGKSQPIQPEDVKLSSLLHSTCQFITIYIG